MKNEKKVVIATHGHLADGFVSALKIIVGELPNLKSVCCYTEAEFDLDKTIIEIMENHDFDNEDLVICTDMMGGSVNNGFVKYLGKYPFQLITNTNLAFLVDLLLTPGGADCDVLNTKAKDELFGVKYVNNLVGDYDNDLDDL